MPWLYFNWIEWLDLLVYLSEFAQVGSHLIEKMQVVGLLRFVSTWGGSIVQWLGGIPGWLLFFVIPTFSLWLRLTLVLVGITGLVGFTWAWLVELIPSESLRHWGWRIVASMSLLSALLLLFQMPTIETWGSTETFLPGLLAWWGMAQIGEGVWVTWVGLVLLGVGSLLELNDKPSQENILDI
jgi:hypothetical protein